MAHTSPYPVLDGAGRPLPVGDGAGSKRLASRLRAGRGAQGTARAGLALRGEGRPCGAGFVPRALEGTEREHGRLPFRAGGNGGAESAGRPSRRGWPACLPVLGRATPDGADAGMPGAVCTFAPCRAASGRDDAGPMLRRELVPLRRGDHAGGNGRCGALCRPEGAALSSPGPAGGARKRLAGLSLPGGIPYSSAFSALEGTARRQGRRGRGCGAQGGRDQCRGNALGRPQGRISRGSKSRAAWARPGGECRRAAGARKACSAWPICPKSFLFHAGGNGAGEGREPGRGWLEEPCRFARGEAASAAGRRGAESVFRWPICPKSFLFHAGGNGAGEGRVAGRGGSKSRAASHGAWRRVPQRGRGRLQSEGCLCGVRARAACVCGRGAKPEGLARYPRFRGGGETVSHRKYAGRRSLCGASPPGMLRRRRAWRGSWGRCIRRPYRRAYCRRRPRR